MNLQSRARIGIWGYGIVGKSAVSYFISQGFTVGVMDRRVLTSQEQDEPHKNGVHVYGEGEKKTFFNFHDYIFLSPGVNASLDYATIKGKLITELDIFGYNFLKPIIAITGSVGKTSSMHMIETLLQCAEKEVAVGGNIGIPTFDLFSQEDGSDYALIEASSFQLQYCKTFAPDIAIWTNFYPNHLDHHATESEYFLAKCSLMVHQKSYQKALINISLINIMPTDFKHCRFFFSTNKPTENQLLQLKANEPAYYCQNGDIVCFKNNSTEIIFSLDEDLANFSFLENIVMLTALCNILEIDLDCLYDVPHYATIPEHRLEKIPTFSCINFYNDSKSTTTASTLAAVKKLHSGPDGSPVHLFLGGLSKGVDRKPFIAELKNYVYHIYCFGKEAEILYDFCTLYTINAEKHDSLPSAFNAALKNLTDGDIALFSPAGSSYDLYTNYEERGSHFKDLVENMATEK